MCIITIESNSPPEFISVPLLLVVEEECPKAAGVHRISQEQQEVFIELKSTRILQSRVSFHEQCLPQRRNVGKGRGNINLVPYLPDTVQELDKEC